MKQVLSRHINHNNRCVLPDTACVRHTEVNHCVCVFLCIYIYCIYLCVIYVYVYIYMYTEIFQI